MTSAGGWAGVLGNSLIMRLIGAPARSGIDRAVSRFGLGGRSAFLLGTGLFSAAISGAMVFIQRMRQPEAAEGRFVDQWLQATAYSLPAMLLGGWALQRYRFGLTFKQDLLMEPVQAAISVMVAGLQGMFGGAPALGMTVWERFKMELGEGLAYLAGGRPVGAIHSTGRHLGTALDYVTGRTPAQLIARRETFGNPAFASEIGAVGRWAGKRGRVERRREETPEGPPEALVWEKENMTTSLGKIDGKPAIQMRKVPLLNLKKGATALDGKFIHVTGEGPWERGKLYEPTVDARGKVKLPDGLVQVVCYHTTDRLCQRFEEIGYDMLAIFGSVHGDRPHS
ncbi:MAG: hypothetical protein HY542_03540, partial [Deltaproteobacteria bacterium]|nr:hypothetical protein [Deltaproteobacteria bacterium]